MGQVVACLSSPLVSGWHYKEDTKLWTRNSMCRLNYFPKSYSVPRITLIRCIASSSNHIRPTLCMESLCSFTISLCREGDTWHALCDIKRTCLSKWNTSFFIVISTKFYASCLTFFGRSSFGFIYKYIWYNISNNFNLTNFAMNILSK